VRKTHEMEASGRCHAAGRAYVKTSPCVVLLAHPPAPARALIGVRTFTRRVAHPVAPSGRQAGAGDRRVVATNRRGAAPFEQSGLCQHKHDAEADTTLRNPIAMGIANGVDASAGRASGFGIAAMSSGITTSASGESHEVVLDVDISRTPDVLSDGSAPVRRRRASDLRTAVRR